MIGRFYMRHTLSIALLIACLPVGCGDEKPGPPNKDGATAKSAATKSAPAIVTADRTWPRFRGVTGDGIADEAAAPPMQVDPATDTLWKTPVPADGYSSPIVWGDRIFLTGEDHRIMAFDADRGTLLWDTALQVAPEPPLGEDEWPFEPGEYGTATPTACTDGRGVYAFWSTGVLGCVTPDGKQVWAKRLVVRPPNVYGLSASPAVFEGVVVQAVDLDADEEGDEVKFRSFIVGVRASDGEQLWRKPRPVYGSWGSPLLIDDGAGTQLVACADPWVISYNPVNGAELWRIRGVTGEIAATPIATSKYVYAFSDPSGSILAVRRGLRGELTDSAVEWRFEDDAPEVPSGICAGSRVVFIGSAGEVQALDAATGEPGWTLELPDTVYASPVLVAGRLLIIDTEGVLRIVDPESGTVDHEAKLGESVCASPAVVGDRIYIRTRKHLICLGKADGSGHSPRATR